MQWKGPFLQQLMEKSKTLINVKHLGKGLNTLLEEKIVHLGMDMYGELVYINKLMAQS